MSLLLQIIVIYIKENIITKLPKLYSPLRNYRAGNKSPALFVKNLVARAIYRPRTKYSLKGLTNGQKQLTIFTIHGPRKK